MPFEANFLGWSITSCIFWLPITKLDRKPHSAISWWWWGWKRMMTSGGLWAPWVRRTWSFDYDGTQRSRWLFSFSCWFIFLNTILELLTFRDNYGIMRTTRRRASCGYEKYLASKSLNIDLTNVVPKRVLELVVEKFGRKKSQNWFQNFIAKNICDSVETRMSIKGGKCVGTEAIGVWPKLPDLSILSCESHCWGRKWQLDSPALQVGFIVRRSQRRDLLKDIVLDAFLSMTRYWF